MFIENLLLAGLCINVNPKDVGTIDIIILIALLNVIPHIINCTHVNSTIGKFGHIYTPVKWSPQSRYASLPLK